MSDTISFVRNDVLNEIAGYLRDTGKHMQEVAIMIEGMTTETPSAPPSDIAEDAS